MPILTYMHKIRQITFDPLAITVAALIMLMVFSFNLYISGVLGGVALFAYLVNQIPSKKAKAFLWILGAGILTYTFFGNFIYIAAILIGANLVSYYLSQKNSARPILEGTIIFNVILLSAVILSSGIEKFRGVNKLDPTDIRLTIPILLIIMVSSYLLEQVLKSVSIKFNKQILSIIKVIVIGLSYAGLAYFFYEEAGISLILGPLLAGLTAAFLEDLASPHLKPVVTLAQIFLVVVFSYNLAGLLGVALAMMGAYIFVSPASPTSSSKTFFHLSPLLFLFAAAEIRENAGLITRFNLVTGYQTGWLLLAGVGLLAIQKIRTKSAEVLEKNDMKKIFPIIATIFTFLLLAIIMRFGRDESVAALIVVSSLFLFLPGLLESDKDKEPAAFMLSLGSFIGSLAFLVLTRL